MYINMSVLIKNNSVRILKDVINRSDILLEVIDIRMPRDTRIYELEKYITKKGKAIILVLNKADLVPEDFAETVREEFQSEFPTVYVSSKTRKGTRVLRNLIKEYSPEKQKIYVGLFGYPNTGKSSIINVLVGRRRARTAPIPGFTKGIQIVKLSSKHYLVDTPGIYYPKDINLLAILGVVRPEKLEYPEKVVEYLIEKLPKIFIRESYKIDFADLEDLLRKISDIYKIKGKDWRRRSAIKILNDWIKGKIKGYWF
ncbi:MAG TPA: GTPase RsgA [Candidatus Nanopusillus sp.]|nr:GTPase RsgA [Candidatus Nanopusillus sp.]